MGLTSTSLLIAAVVATVAGVAATVAVWPLRHRWLRLGARTLGVLLCEALLVATAGLVLNRVEDFYPSWAALAGRTGGDATTQPQHQGLLDQGLAAQLGAGAATTLPWQPANVGAWGLGASARVVVPGDYLRRASATFPTVLVLADGSAGSAQAEQALAATTDVVGVVVAPTRRTTVRELAVELPARLGHDLRVTGRGWVLVANAAQAGLACGIIRADPGRFSGLAVLADPTTDRTGGNSTGTGDPAGGNATAGTDIAGSVDPGKATAGKAHGGKATKGKAPAGKAKAGKAKGGPTTSGPTRSRPGESRPGESRPGETNAGKANTGNAGTGKGGPGRGSTGGAGTDGLSARLIATLHPALGLPVAVIRAALARTAGAPAARTPLADLVTLVSAPAASWRTAIAWAARLAPVPLAAPLVLPAAAANR